MIDLLIRLYPRSWRERYEQELRALLEDTGCRPGVAANLAAGALRTQVRYRRNAINTMAFLAGFMALEVFAVRTDVTENIFWVPRGITSLGLLLAVVGCLTMAARPLGRFVARRVLRSSTTTRGADRAIWEYSRCTAFPESSAPDIWRRSRDAPSHVVQ